MVIIRNEQQVHMSEFSLVGKSQQSLSIFGIGSSFLLLLLVVVVAVVGLTEKWAEPSLSFEYRSSIPETRIAVYYDVGEGIGAKDNYSKIVASSGDWKEIQLVLPATVIHSLRLDPSISPGTIGIRNIRIIDGTGAVRLQVPLSAIQSGSCITTTTTSSSVYEGYVNKYGDLLAAYNASGGSQTKSAWGKAHYCNNGRNEDRTYSGLSTTGNQILSRIEQNGALEVQTTPDAYDPNLPIRLEKKINLHLSGGQATSVKVKRMISRAISVWWVIALAGLLIFDLYYRPLFQRRTSLLYRIIRGDPDQKPKTIPIKKRPMDYLAGTVILLFLIYAAVFTPYLQDEPHIRADGVDHHIWTHGIKSGDFSFCKYQRILGPYELISGGRRIPYPNPDYPTGELKLTCSVVHSPGVALIRLPLMIWFVDPRSKNSFSNAEHQISQLSAIIALMLIIIVVTKILRHHHIGSENVQLAIITVVFGAGLYHYATYDNSYSHVYTALGVSLFSLATFVNHGKYDSPRYLFLLLVLSLLFVLVRMTNVFIVLFFWAFWVYQQGIKKNIPRVLVSGFGVLGAVVVQMAYNYLTMPEFAIRVSGDDAGFMWDRSMFWSVLFAYYNGVMSYFPILGVALLAGLVCKKTRILTFWYMGMIVFYALLYGFWGHPSRGFYYNLGGGFGHRGFVFFGPLSIMILAMAWNELKYRTRIIFQILCVFSTLITLQLMWGFWQNTLSNPRTEQGYWSHLMGQEGTPYYWYAILMIVCAAIFSRNIFGQFKERKYSK